MAAHLQLMDHRVTLYNRASARLGPIRESAGRVVLSGCCGTQVVLPRITSDPAVAAEADIVFFTIPANVHRKLAVEFAPFMRAGQLLVLHPGRTCGAYEMKRTLADCGVRGVSVAETQTVLYTSRAEGVRVRIEAIKPDVPLAALPADDDNPRLTQLLKIYPQLRRVSSTLITGLGNVGMILHPLPMLLNTGWIELPDNCFRHYYEGISPSVARLLEQLDAERLAVAQAFGVATPSVLAWLSSTYGSRGDDLYSALQNTKSYEIVTAPQTLRHRYLWEDVPTGLVPLEALGQVADVKVPLTRLGIDLANAVCGCDFRGTGRGTACREIAVQGIAGAARLLT
jgi:opine dehydrogenase